MKNEVRRPGTEKPRKKSIVRHLTFVEINQISDIYIRTRHLCCFDSSSTDTLRRLHVWNSSLVACIACTFIFVCRRVPFVWLPELIDHVVTSKTFQNKAKLGLYDELFETIVACGVLVQMKAHLRGF